MKITVYAISKNEEQFVDRWIESMSEADEIVVLDTGSSDNTIKKLQTKGAKVAQKIINPWRFDVARNESLKLVPADTDICVCTDLDEVFEKGWRNKLESSWNANTRQLRYKYVWNVLENNEDGITFLYEKIHALKGFKWVYPVHEVLDSNPKISLSEVAENKDIVLRHFPDPEKSRGQYLALLELSVKEDPTSDRNTHYLAREYMFKGKFEEAIKTFKKHLKLKTAIWREERSASLRYIGDCYLNLGRKSTAKKYYNLAIQESFNTREGYLALAKLQYNNLEFLNCIFTITSMLQITQKNLSYITNPDCWNGLPHDMLAYCFFKIGLIDKAIQHTLKALEFEQNNDRLKNNLKFYNATLKQEQNKK